MAYVENLVLHYNNNSQDYDEYLVQYNITADEFVELSNNGQLQSSENVTITTLEQGFFESNTLSKTCQRVCETIYVDCSSGAHNAGNIDQWTNCTEGNNGGTLPRAYQSCTSSCPTIDAGDSGGGGGTGSGSGSGGTGSGNVITNPNANEPCVTGRGTTGISGNDGCITTVDDEARNQLFDRLATYMTSQDQADWVVLDADIESVNALNNYLDQSTVFNSSNYNNSAIELINFHMESDWKELLRQAVANGITSSAELTHKIYKKLSQITDQYPSSIGYINSVVDEFKDIADEVFDTNPQTLDWTDLFGIWLFELGTYPAINGTETITFDGDDTTTESLKQQEGVTLARQDAIDKINNNNITIPVNRGWTYGQGQFYDGMINGNIATSFLGSYNTNVVIAQNPNGTHTLTFTVSNPSTWDSATRLRIDNDGDGNHDGIFPNKERDTGIKIGGSINQTWTWTETL
ncbi:MAG: hypothetical protein AB8B65_09280 [Kordia sp.]|uniref:hypothetical protein n=1 Tax=Kordia sp. TaxID=1965332 RepID=UPI00385E93B9